MYNIILYYMNMIINSDLFVTCFIITTVENNLIHVHILRFE